MHVYGGSDDYIEEYRTIFDEELIDTGLCSIQKMIG